MRAVIGALVLPVLVACSGPPLEDVATGSGVSAPVEEARSAGATDRIDLSSLRGRIVFSNEVNDVWTMRVDGSRLRRLTDAPFREFDPTWSPDGRWIAFRRQPGDEWTAEIFVMRADGSEVTNLTRNQVSDWGPDWSPDGTSIAFNSSRGTGSLRDSWPPGTVRSCAGSDRTSSSTRRGLRTGPESPSWRWSPARTDRTPSTTCS